MLAGLGHFRKKPREEVRAQFTLTPEQTKEVKEALEQGKKVNINIVAKK